MSLMGFIILLTPLEKKVKLTLNRSMNHMRLTLDSCGKPCTSMNHHGLGSPSMNLYMNHGGSVRHGHEA